MICQRCNQRESTGFVIHLCDECFDAWEADLKAGKADVEPVDKSLVYQSAGGFVPNDVKTAAISGGPEDVRVRYLREEVDEHAKLEAQG